MEPSIASLRKAILARDPASVRSILERHLERKQSDESYQVGFHCMSNLSPFMLAAMVGCVESVSCLLKHMLIVEAKRSETRLAPLTAEDFVMAANKIQRDDIAGTDYWDWHLGRAVSVAWMNGYSECAQWIYEWIKGPFDQYGDFLMLIKRNHMFRVYRHEWDETSLFDETTRHHNDFHTFYEQMHVFAAPNCKQIHDEWLETHIDSVRRDLTKEVVIQCFQNKLQELAETLSTHVDPQDVPDEFRH
jgi:hypothetical protein